MEKKAFDIRDRGLAVLNACHIETYTDYPTTEIISILGDGACFKMNRGTLCFCTKDAVNIPYIFDINDVKETGGVYLNGVTMDDIITTTKCLCKPNRDGLLKINDCSHYQYSKTFQLISNDNTHNIMCDGLFTKAISNTELTKDLVFIKDYTTLNTWRDSGTLNINCSGTGLNIVKYADNTAPGRVCVAVPIQKFKRHNAVIPFTNKTLSTGYLDIYLYY